MRIGVDVMGGDYAPDEILTGALSATELLEREDELILVGDEKTIRSGLERFSGPVDRVRVVGTTQTISMAEQPVEAVRSKKDSSLVVLCQMAGRKAKAPLDGIISAGNTGAFVSAAQMHLRRLPNVHRPGIATPLPTFAGPVVLIDVGANIEPKPHHLAQYGVMGAAYARRILSIKEPRVAIMNVGGEAEKGTAEQRRARDMLSAAADINFIGNIEGRAVFDGGADVVVTDGVVGNVMIKLAEGLSAGIFKAIGREVAETDPELAARLEPLIRNIYARHDYHEYGGAPLLGVNGHCLICHGSSKARTIRNAVVRCKQIIESGLNEAIVDRLGTMEEALV